MNAAILLSGGIGSRLYSEVPKQYIRIGGRMLITYALVTLAKSPFLDQILIVAEEAWREAILSDAAANGVPADKITGFASPGFNRQGSILNGMRELLRRTVPEMSGSGISEGLSGGSVSGEWMEDTGISDDDTVFIHDAARPLLSGKQVADCFAALGGHDGVMPVLPMKDTIYLSRDRETVSELLDRSLLFAGQAPELFRLRKYYRANLALTPERLAAVNGSTEPAVLAGMDIAMIAGEENNFKITTPQDLERFRSAVCRDGSH